MNLCKNLLKASAFALAAAAALACGSKAPAVLPAIEPDAWRPKSNKSSRG